MIFRVQTAINVKKAILTKIGFDASVLEHGYRAIQDTIKDFADRSTSISLEPDEDTLTVPGGGKIDKT